MISIAMSTYNGIKYIGEQLDSIRKQSLLPEEVIIIDDCSTDGTAEYICKYIEDNHLMSSWRLICNERNKGFKINFKEALELCKGEFIFFSDQDDIWHLDKIEKMMDCMQKYPDIEVLVSDYVIQYEGESKNSGYSMYAKEMCNDGSVQKLSMGSKWHYVGRPGCTYCVRKSLYNEIRDKWNTEFAHDEIMWRHAMIRHSLGLFQYATIDFRRHGDNATSRKKVTRIRRIQDVKNMLLIQREFLGYVNDERDAERKIICNCIDFLSHRLLWLEQGKIKSFVYVVTKYREYYLFSRNILTDFLCRFMKE